jgi:hypothetical protein
MEPVQSVGVDFKLCLHIDACVAAAQVLVAVVRRNSLTRRFTHTRRIGGMAQVQGAGVNKFNLSVPHTN